MEHGLVGDVPCDIVPDNDLLMCAPIIPVLVHVGSMVPLESEIDDFRILGSTSQLSLCFEGHFSTSFLALLHLPAETTMAYTGVRLSLGQVHADRYPSEIQNSNGK